MTPPFPHLKVIEFMTLKWLTTDKVVQSLHIRNGNTLEIEYKINHNKHYSKTF